MSVYEEKESYATSRAGGLGGTDMAAVLGLSPWKKPIDIFAGKVSPEKQPELDKECLFWGSALEPIVRDRYAKVNGISVVAPNAMGSIFSRSKPWNDSTLVIGREPWMLGAPDGWIMQDNAGLEIKTSSRRTDEWGAQDSEEVPSHYYVQASWYMAVCEARSWQFGVLFSGNTLERFKISRDLEFEKNMIEIGRAFWFDYVVKKVEPPIDESESYGKYLAKKFSLNTGKIITNPSEDIIHWTAEMKLAADEEKAACERKQLANNHLRALVGEAQKAITPLGTIGWIRPAKRDVVDYAAICAKYEINQPNILAEFSKPRQDDPYLRAWWKK